MRPPLEFGKVYHIYNRSNNREKLFLTNNNYRFFLQRYAQHIIPIADTYAYCLLPDHFHFMIQVKDMDEIRTISTPNGTDLDLSKSFSNLFNSYAKAFNKQTGRRGKLFELPFERVAVEREDYFSSLVYYIHRNPVHHGLTKNFEQWRFSSYKALVSNRPTHLKREAVLEWFGGREEFIRAHDGVLKNYLDKKYYLEE